jgi:hypothetical protein
MLIVHVTREPLVGGVASFHDAYLLGAAIAGLGLISAFFVQRTRYERDESAPQGALVH